MGSSKTEGTARQHKRMPDTGTSNTTNQKSRLLLLAVLFAPEAERRGGMYSPPHNRKKF